MPKDVYRPYIYIYVCVCVCIYIYIYIKLNHFAVQQKLTQIVNQHRELRLVLCDDLEGWDRRRWGAEGGARGKGCVYNYN